MRTLHNWDDDKKKQALPMYLQYVALDLVYQLQSQNLMTELTYRINS